MRQRDCRLLVVQRQVLYCPQRQQRELQILIDQTSVRLEKWALKQMRRTPHPRTSHQIPLLLRDQKSMRQRWLSHSQVYRTHLWTVGQMQMLQMPACLPSRIQIDQMPAYLIQKQRTGQHPGQMQNYLQEQEVCFDQRCSVRTLGHHRTPKAQWLYPHQMQGLFDSMVLLHCWKVAMQHPGPPWDRW